MLDNISPDKKLLAFATCLLTVTIGVVFQHEKKRQVVEKQIGDRLGDWMSRVDKNTRESRDFLASIVENRTAKQPIEVELVERCDNCSANLQAADIDGGRCTSCGSMLTSVVQQ